MEAGDRRRAGSGGSDVCCVACAAGDDGQVARVGHTSRAPKYAVAASRRQDVDWRGARCGNQCRPEGPCVWAANRRARPAGGAGLNNRRVGRVAQKCRCGGQCRHAGGRVVAHRGGHQRRAALRGQRKGARIDGRSIHRQTEAGRYRLAAGSNTRCAGGRELVAIARVGCRHRGYGGACDRAGRAGNDGTGRSNQNGCEVGGTENRISPAPSAPTCCGQRAQR